MHLKARTGAIALGVLALTATALASEPKTQPSAQHIEIVASRFSFAPKEITVKKGETVTITIKSTDVTHGLAIPALNLRTTKIKKGQPEDLTLTAGQTGTFQGKCAHFCGKGHGSMILTVHVVE
jgi:cytochrome c oxidase subunit II